MNGYIETYRDAVRILKPQKKMLAAVEENDEYSISPVMENVSTINRHLYFEVVKARGKNKKSVFLSVIGIMMVPGGLLIGNWAVAVLSLMIALLALFSHVIIGTRDFGKLQRLHHDGQWVKTISFYSDRIESNSGNHMPTVAKYEDIRRELETEHMYVLEFGNHTSATMMCKDSFTSGSLDLLKQFILEMRQNTVDARKSQSNA